MSKHQLIKREFVFPTVEANSPKYGTRAFFINVLAVFALGIAGLFVGAALNSAIVGVFGTVIALAAIVVAIAAGIGHSRANKV